MKLKAVETVGMKAKRQVRDALEAIRKDNPNGLLVAEEVVEAARDNASPLHGFFPWDQKKAAQQWWLQEARRLIRVIRVTFPDDSEEKEVPRYVSLRSDRQRPGGGYREAGQVMNNKKLLAELEETAKLDPE